MEQKIGFKLHKKHFHCNEFLKIWFVLFILTWFLMTGSRNHFLFWKKLNIVTLHFFFIGSIQPEKLMCWSGEEPLKRNDTTSNSFLVFENVFGHKGSFTLKFYLLRRIENWFACSLFSLWQCTKRTILLLKIEENFIKLFNVVDAILNV
jgi:hypothetical protein